MWNVVFCTSFRYYKRILCDWFSFLLMVVFIWKTSTSKTIRVLDYFLNAHTQTQKAPTSQMFLIQHKNETATKAFSQDLTFSYMYSETTIF